MSAKEHFDIATHIYTRLRRLSGRTVDVIWMVHNQEYAREVLKLVRTTQDAEALRLAERFEQLVFGAAPKAGIFTRTVQTPAAAPAPEEDDGGQRYVGALR